MNRSRTARIDLAALRARTTRLDTRDPKIYAKRIDRLRRGFINRITRLWFADFQKETRKLVASVSAKTPIEWRNKIIAASKKLYDPTKTYEQTYATVYPFFAERVYDGLTGGKSFTKADPALVEAWEKAAIEWIRNEGSELITAVEGTSHAAVVRFAKELSARAIVDGWSISRLKVEFLKKMKGLEAYRARAIARTEVMRASNIGSRAGAAATGLKLDKEWNTGPKGTGDRHATSDYPGLNGQRRAFNRPYHLKSHRPMHPHDLSLPPEESINCRCSESYIPK